MAKDIEVGGPTEYGAKDYHDPPPAPLIDREELGKWSLYRAVIAEFIATLLFLYITVLTVIGYKSQSEADNCGGVGILGIAWAFGGMIFVLVYCTAGISGELQNSKYFDKRTKNKKNLLTQLVFECIAGGHINPAVTFGLFLARKVSLVRAVLYIVAQSLGAICGCGLVKAFQKAYYVKYGGGANSLADGYSTGTGLAAEIIGTFVLVYTVFSATDPKRNARDSHVPVSKNYILDEVKTPLFFFLVPILINLKLGFAGFGTASNWIRCVHGSLGHNPNHRNWHQPSPELRSRRDIRQG